MGIWESFFDGAAKDMGRGVPENVLINGVDRLYRAISTESMIEVYSGVFSLALSFYCSQDGFTFRPEKVFRGSWLTQTVHLVVKFDIDADLGEVFCFRYLFKKF